MEKILFINILCILEGAKTAVKEHHWVSENLNEHKLLGEIYSKLDEFEDTFAESMVVLVDKINLGEIKGIQMKSDNIVEDIFNLAIKTKEKLPTDDARFAGIHSVTDAFIADMTKYLYLSKMY